MGVIQVIQPGMLSSVQDVGREGYRHAGVPKSGAFDSIALCIGNRLLGNAETDAAIEMTMTGGEYRFTASTIVCLTGANAVDAMIINGDHQDVIHHQRPTVIPKGSTIRVGRLSNGARGYLCVAGGIQCPLVLGSRSALVSLPGAGLSRALRKGDSLLVDEHEAVGMNRTSTSGIQEPGSFGNGPHLLRIVPGAHIERFTESQRVALGELAFRISDQSNRAGVRLSESKIPGEPPDTVASEGTLPGYVQAPPSGEPIILGIDGPTTGGYPVIACVIEADLPVLAQCEIREQVQFQWVSRAEALKALADQYAMIQSVQQLRPIQLSWDCHMHDQSCVHLGCDTGEAQSGPGRDREMVMLQHVSAVSIACGGHAGDEDSMREAISAASEHGCLIGAHPSYPDRKGFGRSEIEIDRAMLGSSLKEQLTAFSKVANECDATVSYIKAHGALYHAISRDISFARWYWALCTSIFPQARFVGPIGSSILNEFKSSGISVLAEGFCDRVYESDGSLRPRNVVGACISEPELAVAQAERLINESNCELLCVHSDTNNAIEIAQAVRERLSLLGYPMR